MNVELNEIIKSYLDSVVNHIKNKEAHNEIKSEVKNHILDISYELIENGYSEIDSINIAIQRMGNPKEIGSMLNNVHKSNPDYITIYLVIGIIVIGIISATSLSYNNIISLNTMIKNILSMVIGIIGAVGIYFFDYRKIKYHSYKCYAITLFFTSLFFIIDIYGNLRSNGILILSGKLSLLTTMCFLISLSGIIQHLNLTKFKNILLLSVLSFIPVVFQILIPRLSLSLFYIFTLSIIVLKSIDWQKYKFHIIITLITLIIIPSFILAMNPYRIDRIVSGMPLIFKTHDGEFNNMQTQSMKILLDSNIFGKGISNIDILPSSELSSNFIFTYIVHSFGWFLSLVSILIIVSFLVRNFIISSKIKDVFGKNIILSIITMLSFQFILTILYSMGASSFTYGIPFISIDPINTFTNCILVGLLSSIYKRRNLINQDTLNSI